MNRRETIKKLMVASGSLVALPAWANRWDAAQVSRHSSSFSTGLQETLASVADTIIPAGNSIGALSVGMDKFLQKLIDQCYEKEVQDNVKTQLVALETTAESIYGNSFRNCSQPQREEMLLKFSVSTDEAEENFFKLIKSETIRGFNTSREVMVSHHHYKQVPGHFYGCVDVNV
jgi:hypothetical protein